MFTPPRSVTPAVRKVTFHVSPSWTSHTLRHRIPRDDAAGRRQFARQMERRRAAESDEEALRTLRRGWRLGTETFRQEMLQRMEGEVGEHHFGEERRESTEARAERIIAFPAL